MLIIDTASQTTWVGYISEDGVAAWERSTEEASHALFACLKQLELRDIQWKGIRSIAYNQGPGSMLGIRTAIMAIRTWSSAAALAESPTLYAYNSLAIGSRIPDAKGSTLIVTDARRKSWNAYRPQDDSPQIQILSNAALEAYHGEIRILQEFNQWTRTDAQLVPLAYDPRHAFADSGYVDLIKPVDIPTPLVLRESEYQKWVPRYVAKEEAPQ